ncbi:MAG: hypothetical protein RIB45_04485 [Marivibrio sp.]
MRALLFALLMPALAGCALLEPPPAPYDPQRFRDDPDAYGLVVADVAAGTLSGWALVLQEAGGAEAIFRPPAGTRPPRGVVAIARALPPGRWRPVRVMAVEDGRPCGAGDAAPLTRAVYSAQLDGRAQAFDLRAGESLYLGRLGITADLFDCDGAQLTVRASAGAAQRATERVGHALDARRLFPETPLDLRTD